MSPEIITVQIGDYANHVGAHLWNLQDESIACSGQQEWKEPSSTVDHGVLCSWNEDRHGSFTYCPRAVVVDLSGSLGGLSFSDLPAESTALSTPSWEGHVEIRHISRAAKSQYRKQLEAASQVDPDDEGTVTQYQQALEAAANALQGRPTYWTDYLQVDLHPSCVLTLSGVWRGIGQWDGWGPAVDSSSTRETTETAVDKVRWWAEQCDHIQGVQVLTEDVGGWGSLSLKVVTELREQYPGLPMLYYSLQKQQANTAQASSVRRELSQAISTAEVTQVASMYVPLSVPVQRLMGADGAALLAAAVDTSTLCFRCTGASTAVGSALGSTDMHSVVQLLAGQGANMAALSLQLPAGRLHRMADARNGSSNLVLSAEDEACMLTPGVRTDPSLSIAESITLRGVRLGSALATTTQSKLALDQYLVQDHVPRDSSQCTTHACISPMPAAFPVYFPAGVVKDSIQPTSDHAMVANLGAPVLQYSRPTPAVMTRLTATRGFQSFLRSKLSRLRSLKETPLGRTCLEQWGYSSSDASELRESIQHLLDQYNSEQYND